MQYQRTPKAWESLTQPARLGPLAHTVLLMANGRRTVTELAMLTGAELDELIESLCNAGYLEAAQPDVLPSSDIDRH